MGFPGGSDGQESACNAGDLGLIPGLGRRSPGGGHGNPFQYACLENPHGQRRLAGYSSWGCEELGMTEKLSIHPSVWVQMPRSLPPLLSLCGHGAREAQFTFHHPDSFTHPLHFPLPSPLAYREAHPSKSSLCTAMPPVLVTPVTPLWTRHLTPTE